MKKMIIIWIIMASVLVGTLTYIGLKFEEKVKDYQILESDIEESAQIYMQVNELELKYKENVKIKTSKLLEEGILKNMTVGDDECSGYVVITKELKGFSYNAYIKCENYTTLDYE